MDIKQNAIIFCGKTEIPQYMREVVGWLEDSFKLYYRHMPFDQTNGLSWAWGGIKEPIAHVFVILDLKDRDKAIITKIKEKSEEDIDALLQGPDDELPDSFRLILEIKTADSLEPEDEDEELIPPFNPCVISFSEDYMGSLGDRLGASGVGLHINQSDSIFSDKQALLKALASNASSQKHDEKAYKTM